jgi:ribosomal protein S27AE
MDDGDGALTVELQAYQIAQNAILYKGSRPCPQCGVVVNPTEYMYGILCAKCTDVRKNKRSNGRIG